MTDERRKFSRVACYMIARQTRTSGEEEDFFGTVRNMSNGGAMIETEQTVLPGVQVDLAFLLDEDQQIWEGRGQVVWSRKRGEKNVMGLQFSEPLEKNWRQSLA